MMTYEYFATCSENYMQPLATSQENNSAPAFITNPKDSDSQLDTKETERPKPKNQTRNQLQLNAGHTSQPVSRRPSVSIAAFKDMFPSDSLILGPKQTFINQNAGNVIDQGFTLSKDGSGKLNFHSTSSEVADMPEIGHVLQIKDSDSSLEADERKSSEKSHSFLGSHTSSRSSLRENILAKFTRDFNDFLETRTVRRIKFVFQSLQCQLLMFFFLFALVILFISVSLVIVPNRPFPQFTDYNSIVLYNVVFHISYTLAGHLVFFTTEWMLENLSLWIIASNLVGHGATLEILNSKILRARVPGYQVRNYLWILSIIIAVLVSFSAFQFAWTPVISKHSTDQCLSGSYGSVNYKIPVSIFLQGDVGNSGITTYGLPLEDGIVGGFGAWPLANPLEVFSIKHAGYIYLISAECSDVYPTQLQDNSTRTWTSDLKVIGNTLQGKIIIHVPQNSIILDYVQVESQGGYMQECNMRVQFFQGDVENSFHSDQWQDVTYQGVTGITTNSTQMTKGDGQQFYFSDFAQHTHDQYNLTGKFMDMLSNIYNNSTFYPARNEVYSRVLQWATLPDGFYHDSLMWKGVAASLAAAAHLLLVQYNKDVTDICNYYGVNGSGYLSMNSLLLVVIQILIVVLGVTMLLHGWWIYLIYGLSKDANYAYRVIRNRFRFAHDTSKYSASIFAKNKLPNLNYLRTDEETIQKIKYRKVKFGSDKEEISKTGDCSPSALPVLLGTPKDVLNLKRRQK
ncbi:hypothetical protein HDV06_006261 [Boothiomyces sp. JEL0866]|nr:hypothetical protein HDV06_006261 [Boothiomyces sp. JEL0866]